VSPAVALGATLAIQVYTSLAGAAAAVLAPEVAADLSVPSRWIGGYVGLVYFGAMSASLLCGAYLARYVAIRVSQACVALCALGIAGTALAQPGWLPAVAAAAVVLGLGYGPITPASSHILARTTPASRMSLVFSIKQTGVPAGAALAGAVLPAAALAFGWLGARIGARTGILIALAVYTGVTLYAYRLEFRGGVLRARDRDRLRAGRRAVAVAFLLRPARARGQGGRVFRLLQHDGQGRGDARPAAGGRVGAAHG